MTKSPGTTRLEDADAIDAYGAKAVSLCKSLKADLPVPPGFAISADAVAAVDQGDLQALESILKSYRMLGGMVAVRSSAIGEDSAAASFAGQHATILGVTGETQLISAIFEVFGSAFTEHALAYRSALDVAKTQPQMGIVVQRIVNPNAAGVLFTLNPVTGADERVVEAAWGLGEAVVASRVTPDMIRVARGGTVLEAKPGHKPIRLVASVGGGTSTLDIPEAQRDQLCLSDLNLKSLDCLAEQCVRIFGGPQDIEWAIEGDRTFLLQARPITTLSRRLAIKAE